MAKVNNFIIIKHFVHLGTYALEREKRKEIRWLRNLFPFIYMPLLTLLYLIHHPFLKGIAKKRLVNYRLISNHTSTLVH